MATNYKKFFYHDHYSFQELIGQMAKVKSQYAEVSYSAKGKHGAVEGYITLRPTEESRTYKLRIAARVNSTIVSIYPVEPYIGTEVSGKKVPHMYGDGSLCLYYPKYREWKYSDSWADTLIPWASLWLYYYEIWVVTGEWLGGGIHGGKEKPASGQ